MKFLPNKIQLDVLKRHVGPFIFCFFTVMFILLMQFLILHIHRLIGKGLPFGVIVELILTNLAYMVVLAAPMAVLVASLMAFGKFTELNELTALRAAGINPIRTVTPVLAAGLLLSIFLMWFSNDVLPDANQRARSLFLDIRTKKPGFDLQENEFYDGIQGYTFLVKNINSETDSLYNVTLFQEETSDNNQAIIRADKGYLQSNSDETLTLFLYDGSINRILKQSRNEDASSSMERSKFNRYRLSFDLSEMAFSRSNPDKHSRTERTMDAQTMLAVVDTLEREIETQKNQVYGAHTFLGDVEIDEQQGNQFSLSPDTTTADSLYASTYTLLKMAENRNAQTQLYESALKDLRSYRSTFENLQVNTDWRVKRIARYWVEIYKKFSIPLACLIFVLIGAPIGMFTKKGNLGYAALIGVVFLTFFWITIIQGEKLADRLFISPFTGMWFSDILLAIAGAIMMLQISTSFRISNLWNSRD